MLLPRFDARAAVDPATDDVATDRWLRRAVLAMLLAGVALRLIALWHSPAFAPGDLAMARNITERSVVRLLTVPPAFGQIAAPGYLLLQWTAVTVFSAHEWALRIVPILASTTTLLLVWYLGRSFLGGAGQLFAMSGVALGLPFIIFSTHVRPYGSSEVAACLAVLVIGCRLLDGAADGRAWLRGAVLGAILSFFAQLAPLAECCAVCALLANAVVRRQRTLVLRALGLGVWWAVVAFAASSVPSFGTTTTAGGAVAAISGGGSGYPPAGPEIVPTLAWAWQGLVLSMGIQNFHYELPGMFALAALVGGALLLQRTGSAALLLVLTPLAGVSAAALHIVPFQRYFLLWFAPALFICIGAVADAVDRVIARRGRLARGLALGPWLVAPVLVVATWPPPYHLQDMPRVIAYVGERRQPQDVIYAFVGARQALAFYGPTRGVPSGSWVGGGCHIGQPREYLRELDRYRGRERVWVVVAQDVGRDRARGVMTSYLNTIGVLRDSIAAVQRTVNPWIGGAWAYLYDLSDASRLTRADAASFAIPGAVIKGTQTDPACLGGPLSDDTP